MLKISKKIMAVMLSAILILSLIPSALFSAIALSDVAAYADAPFLPLDTPTDVDYDGTAVSGAFRFVTDTDNAFIISSSGDNDTYVSILDENGDQIAYDDDNGDGSNFRVSFGCDAGKTYYLLTKSYSGGEAGYTVQISETDISRIEINDIDVVEYLDCDVIADDNYVTYYHYNYSSPNFTVYFKDGTSNSGSSGTYIGGRYYSLIMNDDQKANHWTGGGTYRVDCTLAGVKCGFNVNVIENPVDYVECEDVIVVENMDGYESWDNDNNEYYRYSYNTPNFRVHYKNGDVSEMNSSGKRVNGEYYYLEQSSDNQYENHWTVGNTYEVPAKFAGVDCKFNVKVISNPITRVQIDDVVLNENVDGYFSTDNDNNEFFYYSFSTPKYAVYLNDGTTTDKNSWSKDIFGNNYSLSYQLDQYNNHLEAGKTYEVPCTFMGFECSFNLTINESPVDRVEVNDVYLINNVGGYETTDYDDQDFFYYDFTTPDYTVYFKDGTVSETSRYEKLVGGSYVGLEYNYDQYETHWTLGNTYTVNARFCGKDCSFNVKIIENPVDYVEVEPLSLTANKGGYNRWDNESNQYFHYDYNTPKYTVHFKDGSVSETNSADKDVNGVLYSLKTSDDQYNNHWYENNTYKASYDFMGITGEFDVTIEPIPIVRIEVDDVTVYDGINGYKTTDYDGVEYFHYYLPSLNYIVYLRDGSHTEKTSGSVQIGGESYWLSYEDNQNNEHWTLGNTYTLNASLGGVKCTFKATVEEIPIARIEFDEVTVIQNIDGYNKIDDDGTQYFHYRYSTPSYVVYYKDGTNSGKTMGDVQIGGSYLGLDCSDDQDVNHWTVGNTYAVSVKVGSFNTSFNVKVVPVPVSRIEVDDIILFENTGGSFVVDSDGNEFYRYTYSPYFIAYYNDGTKSYKTNGSIQIGNSRYGLNYSGNQDEQHWTVGNTYIIPCSILGVTSSFKVTVLENPVDRVEVKPITVYENASGSYSWDGNGEQYFSYDFSPRYTVYYKDGTSSESGYYNGQYYSFTYYNDQYSEHWTVGNTYKVRFTFMSKEGTFDVTVAPNPVDYVEIDDVSVYENADGYTYSSYDGGSFFYYTYSPSYTVHFKDGTVSSKTTSSTKVGDIWYSLSTSDSQYDEPWALGGNYTFTSTFMGVSATGKATVVANPVDHVVVDDIKLYENASGMWNSYGQDMFFQYNYSPSYTVYYKDGTVSRKTTGEIKVGGKSYGLGYSDSQYEEHWQVGGAYTVDCTFMGVKATCTARVVENPIDRIVLENVSLYENADGYETTPYNGSPYFRYSYSPKFTVFLKDGSTVDGTNGGATIDGTRYYISYADTQEKEYWVPGGIYAVTATFMGFEAQFTATVVESPVESVVVNDVYLYENADGYETTYSADNQKYFRYSYSPSYTVYFKDGTVSNSTGSSIKIGEKWYSLETTDSQYSDHWSLGGRYAVDCSFMGVKATCTAVVIENPVASVEFQDLTVIKNGNGWMNSDSEGGLYFDYDYSPVYKVVFKDGTVSSTDSYGKAVNGKTYWLNNVEDDQYNNHWTVGTYQASASFMGHKGVFNVTVVDNTVVSGVEVEGVTVIEGIETWYDTDEEGNSYARYWCPTPNYTVTYANGTKSAKDSKAKLIYNQYYGINTDDAQETNHWTVGGTYPVSYDFCGFTGSFNASVKRLSDVASLLPVLTVSSPVSVVYKNDYMSGLMRFTPSQTGNYTIYSAGEHYVHAMIFDVNGNKIAVADDSDNEKNFIFNVTLQASQTYFIYAAVYSGSYIVGDGYDYPQFSVCVAEGEAGPCRHTSTEVRNRVAATCTAEGYSGDTYCLSCGEKLASGRVLPATGHTGGTATCHTKAKCSVCGEEYGEFDPNNHSGETKLKDAVKATCTNEGYTGDIYCTGCGKMIEKGNVIPATEHKPGDWVIDVKPTLTEKGLQRKKCGVCGKIIAEEEIPALEETYDTEKAAVNEVENVSVAPSAESNLPATTEVFVEKSEQTDKQITYEIHLESEGKQIQPEAPVLVKLPIPAGFDVDKINVYRSEPDGSKTRMDITVSGDYIYFETDHFSIYEILLKLCGDVNDDGSVNNKDLTRLFQYLSDWDVEINEAALDINGDGSVNNKDLTRLFQYLSDWDVVIF